MIDKCLKCINYDNAWTFSETGFCEIRKSYVDEWDSCENFQHYEDWRDKMDFNTYQDLAQRTSNTKCSTSKLVNGVMGLNGEAGECIDIVKKAEFQGHELDVDKLIDELGDVLWYIAEIATGLGKNMNDLAIHNIEKLKKRYPDGFNSERSVNREG